MARAVEEAAAGRGIEIVRMLGRADNPPEQPFQGEWIERSEVLLDLTTAQAAVSNVEKALAAQVPIAVGTTGWDDRIEEVKRSVESRQGACLYASNFSLGMQVLFFLAGQASQIFGRLGEYDPYIWEAHHRAKIDAPSGTALTLAGILEEHLGRRPAPSSLRAGSIPGTHVVGFDSPADTLELRHSARNRRGFAEGALVACRWLKGKQGFFTMQDVIRV